MKLQINLPDFDGFYNTILDDLYEITDDIENYGDVTEEEYNTINWKEVYKSIGEEYTYQYWEQNKEQLKELGINNIKFIKIDSPRFYNYSTDKLVVEVDFNSRAIKTKIKELKDSYSFKQYIKENYSSFSGFYSFYSNDSNTWTEEYLKKITKDNIILEGFLMYYMENDFIDYDKESLNYSVYEKRHEFLTFIEG